MKWKILFIFLMATESAIASEIVPAPGVIVREVDQSPSARVRIIQFPSGSVSVVDATATVTIGGGGDNLGSHVATAPINANGFPLDNVSSITTTGWINASSETVNVTLGVGTSVPRAMVHIASSPARATDKLLIISTNTNDLLTITSASMTVNMSSTVFTGSIVSSGIVLAYGSSIFITSVAVTGPTGGGGGIFFGATNGPKNTGIQAPNGNIRFIVSNNSMLDFANSVVSPQQVIQGVDGSESGPAYSFNQTTSQGIYRISGQGLAMSIGGNERFRWGAASSTISGNLVLSSNTAAIGISTAPTSKLDILNGSITVRVQAGSNTGIGGGVSASTFTINGTGIFVSSWNAREYDGYSLYRGSDTLAGNTSKRIIGIGLTSFIGLGCWEIENVNTPGISVRMKAQTIVDRFDCYNADAINNKDFSWLAMGKP